MLMRFDPLREMDPLRPPRGGIGAVSMPMDAYRRGDEFIVELELPGVDPEKVDVTVDQNMLDVSVQRNASYDDDDTVIAAERRHGTMTRRLFLGEVLDTDRIRASFDHGVLTVVLPVAEEAKPHRIQITAGNGGRTAVGAGAGAEG